MKVDLELGGTDQTFNMLAGRTLVKAMLGKEKFVMTVPLLADSKGVKIGKTEGNVIGLTDPPNDFYAKIMSLSDDAIVPCFKLLTDLPMEEIESMKQTIEKGANPMDFKKKLAFQLTEYLHTESEAHQAEVNFELIHQRGQSSQLSSADIPMLAIKQDTWDRVEFLSQNNLASSKSEAKRLLEQNAVEQNDIVIHASKEKLTIQNGDIIKVGKKRLFRIKLT